MCPAVRSVLVGFASVTLVAEVATQPLVEQWTRTLGEAESRTVFTDLSISPSGDLYTTGITNSDLEGANVGRRDAFVARYTSSGSLE